MLDTVAPGFDRYLSRSRPGLPTAWHPSAADRRVRIPVFLAFPKVIVADCGSMPGSVKLPDRAGQSEQKTIEMIENGAIRDRLRIPKNVLRT